jgi:hypothetical protein
MEAVGHNDVFNTAVGPNGALNGASAVHQPVDYGAGCSQMPFDSGTAIGMEHGSDPNANVDLSTYGHSHAAW